MSQGSSRLHRRDAVACGLRQLAVAAMLLVGPACRRKRPLGKAEGSVTFQGKPVEAGAVIFSNDDLGVAYVGHLGAGGFFRFEVADGYGLPPATYKVGVGPPQPKPTLEVELARTTNVSTDFPNIPAKYFDPNSSGISVEVREGDNLPYRIEVP